MNSPGARFTTVPFNNVISTSKRLRVGNPTYYLSKLDLTPYIQVVLLRILDRYAIDSPVETLARSLSQPRSQLRDPFQESGRTRLQGTSS